MIIFMGIFKGFVSCVYYVTVGICVAKENCPLPWLRWTINVFYLFTGMMDEQHVMCTIYTII